jgi:hypothetical protein
MPNFGKRRCQQIFCCCLPKWRICFTMLRLGETLKFLWHPCARFSKWSVTIFSRLPSSGVFSFLNDARLGFAPLYKLFDTTVLSFRNGMSFFFLQENYFFGTRHFGTTCRLGEKCRWHRPHSVIILSVIQVEFNVLHFFCTPSTGSRVLFGVCEVIVCIARCCYEQFLSFW